MDNPVIMTISQGFYFFGDEVEVEDGYLGLKEAAMFGDFGGDLGMPGVARGADGATVLLDRFRPEDIQRFPINAVIAVHPSVNLYEFEGTTLR